MQEVTRGLGGQWRWPVGGAALGVAIGTLLVVVSGLQRGFSQAQVPEPVLSVIPRPTANPTATPALTATEPAPPPETPTPDPSAGLGITVGDLVEVYGTGGDGLRVRAEPGLSARVLFLALENEVLLVRGGPAEADGRVWWFLVSPNDESRGGWAVGEYLRRIGLR